MSTTVSIITATYNDGEFLQECIDSVLNQSYDHWQWVIVDNGSTDSTRGILKSLDDGRIEVIRLEENVGVSAGRNKALIRASGSYICFLDGDDVLPKHSVAARAEVLDHKSEVDFVDGIVYSFSGSKDHVIGTYSPKASNDVVSDLLSLNGSIFMGNTWMIRVHSEKQYRFDPELMHGEELLLYATLANTGKYAAVSEPVLWYRRHDRSAMSNLEGLLSGYIILAKKLSLLPHVDTLQLRQFRKKARSIMVRTFLKEGAVGKAMHSYVKLSAT